MERTVGIIKPSRARKFVWRFSLIMIVGASLSFIQAWGSLLLYSVNTRDIFDITMSGSLFDPGWRSQNIYGVFGASESNTRGKGPAGQSGYAWWFYANEYKYGIEAVMSSNAIMTEQQMPWGNYNPGFTLDRRPPAWSIASNVPTKHDTMPEHAVAVYELAAGWPIQSWYGAAIDRGADKAQMSWSVLLVKQAGAHAIIFPLRPMPGLLINAMMYGLLAYLGGSGSRRAFVRVRRLLRRRRDQCIYCAYNITNLITCPECGHEVGADARKASTSNDNA